MRLAARLARGRKGFSQPPFWSLSNLRSHLLSAMPDQERIENNFHAYVEGAYKSDGVVFACILTRLAIFSQARFMWREFRNGRPGELFGNAELGLLERPWANGTTGELLASMEVDASLAGNFFATVVDDAGRFGRAATGPSRRIARIQPDRVTIVLGSRSGNPHDLDTKVIGYLYEPPSTAGVPGSAVTLTPDQVIHYSPLPDPQAKFRGMSWLTPILREIDADKAATAHKLKFFENGASLQTVVSLDKEISQDAFEDFVEWFKANHKGTDNAYGTLFLAGGADVNVVGADLKQLEFKATQGAGETRIAAAAGVHPVIVGLSEGMQGSSLNAGNFNAARRLTTDKTIRWLWQNAAASLESVLTAPSGSARLWTDDRDIAFLREDEKDLAEIRLRNASTLRQLTDSGWEPDAALEFIAADDINRMRGRHTGVFSVQLQPPGTEFESTTRPLELPARSRDEENAR